jgi:hypothetical protein
MDQISLLKDHDDARKSALEADIYGAGGFQIVGHDLKLNDDPETAGRVLNNKMNENGRHRLSALEVWQIKQWARQRSGVSRLHELESDDLKFEGKWLTSEDLRLRRRKRKAAILAELMELEQEEE